MTNGDVIRNKITDDDIAHYTTCGDMESCETCPFYNLDSCKDFSARVRWLGEDAQCDSTGRHI